MLEERYGKLMMLKLKLSRLSYNAVKYFPFSIVTSISKYDSFISHSVGFFSCSSQGYMSLIAESNAVLFSVNVSHCIIEFFSQHQILF